MTVEENVLMVAELLLLTALPFGVTVLLNGPLFTERMYVYSAITVALTASAVMLIMLVNRDEARAVPSHSVRHCSSAGAS